MQLNALVASAPSMLFPGAQPPNEARRKERWDHHEGSYKWNFAHDLLRARHGDDTQLKPIIIDGGHCSPIDDQNFDEILKFADSACPKN